MATLTQISQALNDLLPKLKPAGAVPTGCIAHFHSVPDGWLLCNGAAVSRTTYANLFAVIGTKYGTGDGSTTFNLPNLAGRFLESTTNAGEVGTLKNAGLPNITGKTTWLYGLVMATSGAFSSHTKYGDAGAKGNARPADEYFNFNASGSNSTFGAASTVQPPAISMFPCIKI